MTTTEMDDFTKTSSGAKAPDNVTNITEIGPEAEAAKVEKLAASFIEAEVPEDKRELVPSGLSPVEQMEWVMKAKAMGVFVKPAPASGPDTKRPSTKRVIDTSGMTPMQKIMAGLS